MNIVIYGCDNSGKTTLSMQLVEYLNEDIDFSAQALHSLGPNKTKEEMCRFMESNLLPKGSTHTNIFDRFPIIEEEVYGNLLRGKSKFDDLDYIKNIFDKVDIFIFCNPGIKTILNWGDREQMDGVKDNAMDIINAYNKFTFKLINMGYNVKEYNFKCDNYKDLVWE